MRNVGITDGKIVTITEEAIQGKDSIDASPIAPKQKPAAPKKDPEPFRSHSCRNRR